MTCIVQEGYAKRQVCAVLGVSRASYYRRCKRQTRTVCAKRQRLRAHVKALFEASGRSYGSRRIKVALMAQDIMVGRYQIRQIMRELDIRPVWKKAFVRTIDSQHKLPVAENLLDQQFNPRQPNQAWVGDITYIRTQSGWLYLAAVMDLYSRKIVGYAMSSRMTADLVCTALQLAIQMRQPPAGLILHTDRGSQYCSGQYQSLLSHHEFRCSMSGKGFTEQCSSYDNAVMERFFLSLKTERVWQQHYANHQEAIRDISRYIVVFYNGVRLHSTLGGLSVAQSV